MGDKALIHATCILIGGRGVLLRGASGMGKSDLALRLIRTGSPAQRAMLVADDQVLLKSEAGELLASAPEALRGLLEVRGLGLACLPFAASASLHLIVDLVARDAVPRLPNACHESLNGVRLPLLRLHAFDDSSAEKVCLAAQTIAVNGFPGHDGRLR